MYKDEFHKRGLAPRNLSRCLEDAGTLTSPLIPWNTCGAAMSTYLGVPTIEYLPYCFLNLVNPVVSIIFGFTGITMMKRKMTLHLRSIKEQKAKMYRPDKYYWPVAKAAGFLYFRQYFITFFSVVHIMIKRHLIPHYAVRLYSNRTKHVHYGG